MRPVAYRIRRVLRARWRATLALTLTVAVVTGIVLSFAGGAERTTSAPDRYAAGSGGGFDGNVQQEEGRPRTAEVAVLPGVSAVDAVTFVFGGLARPGGSPAPDALIFAGSHRAFGSRLVSGREPEVASSGEFVATRSFADAKGVAVGDRFDFFSLTQEQVDRAGYDAVETEGPRGPGLEAVLVGVIDTPAELDDPTPYAVMPPSLLDHADIGIASTIMSVRLRPGTDLGALRAQLDSLPDGQPLSLEPFELISSELRTAVDGQGRALWLLALVGAVAAVTALGQLVTRSVRLGADERSSLAAIGFRRGQLLAESLGRAALPVLLGTILGVGIAVSLSFLFPTGFVRRLEPQPGVRVDPTVLALCAAGLFVTLMAWITAVLALGRPVRSPLRPSALVESVAVRCGRATMSTGVRFAFTRSHGEGGSVRATLAGMLVTVALLVGALAFGSSLARLVTDHDRYGHNWDLITGSGGDSVPDDLRSTLEADGDVAGLMLYGTGQARVGPATLGLAGMLPVKGDMRPKVLSGRLPSADDEIALGRLTAKDLGAEVGTAVEVETEGPTRRLRVTGIAVVPAVEGLDGVGQDGILTIAGLVGLNPDARPTAAVVRLRRGVPPGTAERLGIGQGSSPIVITNLARIRSVPFLLAGLVGALVVLTVVHVMVTSVRNRRRDVAVLRSLGADRRWIGRAVHCQATSFALVPLMLGAPLGLIAGRLVFQAFANSVGAVPDASFPYAIVAGAAAGLVVLANVVAIVPARRARRSPPALVLNAG